MYRKMYHNPIPYQRLKRVDNPPDPGVVRSGFMSGKKNKSEWEQVIETGCFQLVDTVLGGAHP